jgi:hypothetical protein
MAKRKKTKGKVIITLHRKPKMQQHEPHQNPWVNSGALEGLAVPAPLLAPLMLINV